jgi:hypothetical protein
MPIYRAYFATSAVARTKASAAIDLLKTRAAAAAQAAGSLGTTTAPTIQYRVHGVTDLPALAVPSGSTPKSRMLLRPTTPDGRGEAMPVQLPTSASATLLSVASALIFVNAGGSPTLTFKSRLASKVYVESSVATSLPAGTLLQDPATAKKYEVTGTTSISIGTTQVLVNEVSSSQLGDVSYGSVLEIVGPPLGVLPQARVCVMATATVAGTEHLLDKKGRLYRLINSGTATSATAQLAGDLTHDTPFQRLIADLTSGEDLTSIAAGETLTFVTPPAGVAASAVVKTAFTYTLAAGAVFKDLTTGKSYTTTTDATFYDSLFAEITVRAPVTGSEYDLDLSSTLALQDPPDEVDPFPTMIAVSPASTYPERTPRRSSAATPTGARQCAARRTGDGSWKSSPRPTGRKPCRRRTRSRSCSRRATTASSSRSSPLAS